MGRRDHGDDGSVDNPQVLHAVHPQPWIHDRGFVGRRPHLAGTAVVVDGECEVSGHAGEVVVRSEPELLALSYGYPVQLGAEPLQGGLPGDVEDEPDALNDGVQVLLHGEVVGEYHGLAPVVAVSQHQLPPALWAHQHGENHEGFGVLDGFVDLVVYFVRYAEVLPQYRIGDDGTALEEQFYFGVTVWVVWSVEIVENQNFTPTGY